MMHICRSLCFAAPLGVLLLASRAGAAVFITEFCSDTGNNEHYEFVEVTNLGTSPVDMTGWSEDDSNATANKAGHSLTGLGTLAPGESGILTETTPALFREFWALPSTVPVVQYTSDNLSTSSDSITLFNAGGQLVDRLDYGTTNGGSADMVTRNCPFAALGQNRNQSWVDSSFGDSFGSIHARGETLYTLYGNPGAYPVPEPAALPLVALGMILLLVRRKHA